MVIMHYTCGAARYCSILDEKADCARGICADSVSLELVNPTDAELGNIRTLWAIVRECAAGNAAVAEHMTNG